MITAVDTNILLDIFAADPQFGPRSKETIRVCLREGGLIACEVVWAEVACFFPKKETIRSAMEQLGVSFSPMGIETALIAGEVWNLYRQRGGQRSRIFADFLIGAHSLAQADRLLTRDRGFYRSYFSKLKTLDPSI